MITLHHIPYSRSFRILWLLTEMGLDCALQHYAITDGSLRSPEFKAKSPAGRVPALEIDDQVIYESGAITEYLCASRPEHGLGRSFGDEDYVAWLEWLHFSETQASILASLNMSHLFMGQPSAASVATIKIETARLKATLKAMERKLDGAEWLLPSGFSAVDTAMGFNLWSAMHFVKLDEFPNIRAYMARIEARPGYQKARELDGDQAFYAQDFYEVPEG
jgi:glutathione S-transferase